MLRHRNLVGADTRSFALLLLGVLTDYGCFARTASTIRPESLPVIASQLTSEVSSFHQNGGLIWHDLSVSSVTGQAILQPSSGVIRNGQLTGLLGPSGSGKSTMLSALSGLSNLPVDGLVAGFNISEDNVAWLHSIPPKQVAWLQQEDHFFSQLTVKETLDLAAYLELPELAKYQRQELVQQTVRQLGLQHAVHRQVGDPQEESFAALPIRLPWSRKNGKKGGRLSGGERRRLSVALELLTDKELLVADEPTSGLDSAYSAVVVKLLKDLAISRNIPALCSLHSPRSSIFKSLDSIILLAPDGHVCYAGDREASLEYFAKLGHKLPPNTNPAEFLVDLISIDSEDPDKAVADKARIDELAASFAEYQRRQWQKQQNSGITVQFKDSNFNGWQYIQKKAKSRSFFRWIPRLSSLLRRSWYQNIRDSSLNTVRILMSVGNAVLLAGIFPTVSGPIPTVSSIADRVALLSFGAINLCMMSYMKTITLFAQERPVVRREQTRKQYSAAEYLTAKVLAEVPLDTLFTAIFTTVLKECSGLRISWMKLTTVFSLLTMAGASLGFLLGSLAWSDKQATTSGIPVLVILMVVGIINPSGVDLTKPPPMLVQFLKQLSPFTYAIQALCLGEYPGVKYELPQGRGIKGFFARLKNTPRMGGLALVTTGDQVIEALGLRGATFVGTCQQLALISFGNLFVGWLGLLVKQRRQRRQLNRQQSPTVSASAHIEGISVNSNLPLRTPTRVRV